MRWILGWAMPQVQADSATVMLFHVGNLLGWDDEFFWYEASPKWRINRWPCWPAVQHATTMLRLSLALCKILMQTHSTWFPNTQDTHATFLCGGEVSDNYLITTISKIHSFTFTASTQGFKTFLFIKILRSDVTITAAYVEGNL